MSRAFLRNFKSQIALKLLSALVKQGLEKKNKLILLCTISPDFREGGSEQIREGAPTKTYPEPHSLVEEQFILMLR